MSEEEQKAIKTAKCIRAGVPVQTCDDDYIVLLNIIEKQQKEIEKLKQNKKDNMQVIYGGRRFGTEGMVVKDYISKDKIREKIEHYNIELEHIKNGEEFENEKPMYYWGKVALEELLEENNKCK